MQLGFEHRLMAVLKPHSGAVGVNGLLGIVIPHPHLDIIAKVETGRDTRNIVYRIAVLVKLRLHLKINSFHNQNIAKGGPDRKSEPPGIKVNAVSRRTSKSNP